ncbi:PadR family transcriptional regulator [Dactylosporangium sp. CS-047395]|uniref:PadR family transcriptional regulator n=1 Tax=Dactylosporangium sp. CS-047395 TaxID=3239936 RepID=UPI003D94B8F5
MNLTRLVILGLLVERGAQHGHQLRRAVQVTKADDWAGVGAGSLHRELRKLADEALIEAVRVERVDRRPERTVYQITDAGRGELDTLRERAMATLHDAGDPMAAGLIFAGSVGREVLRDLVLRHRRAAEQELARLLEERERGEREGYLRPEISPLQTAAFRRAELRVRAELAWHDEWDAILARADEARA